MDALAQLHEAQTRIHNALVELRHLQMEEFTEDEVKFRLETMINTAIIIQSDLWSLEKNWTQKIKRES